MPRDRITLECTSCKRRNYTSDKNKRNHPGRVEYVKYCPNERKRTKHKEAK
ncbi:MAG: 50S ribosomal protein L33 [Chitinivibrionales bacterium]